MLLESVPRYSVFSNWVLTTELLNSIGRYWNWLGNLARSASSTAPIPMPKFICLYTNSSKKTVCWLILVRTAAILTKPLDEILIYQWLCLHLSKVNIPNIDWKTPIFNACVSGSTACVNLLLQHGASPHAVCDVASPIHEACKRGNHLQYHPSF